MLIPFRTTLDQIGSLPPILEAMRVAGVPSDLITKACDLAVVDQGVYDLMALWMVDTSEREAILGDIREAIADYETPVLYAFI